MKSVVHHGEFVDSLALVSDDGLLVPELDDDKGLFLHLVGEVDFTAVDLLLQLGVQLFGGFELGLDRGDFEDLFL